MIQDFKFKINNSTLNEKKFREENLSYFNKYIRNNTKALKTASVNFSIKSTFSLILSNFSIQLATLPYEAEVITPPCGPGGKPIVVGKGIFLNIFIIVLNIEIRDASTPNPFTAASTTLYMLFNCLTNLFLLAIRAFIDS